MVPRLATDPWLYPTGFKPLCANVPESYTKGSSTQVFSLPLLLS